jgi:hypothetical protein
MSQPSPFHSASCIETERGEEFTGGKRKHLAAVSDQKESREKNNRKNSAGAVYVPIIQLFADSWEERHHIICSLRVSRNLDLDSHPWAHIPKIGQIN